MIRSACVYLYGESIDRMFLSLFLYNHQNDASNMGIAGPAAWAALSTGFYALWQFLQFMWRRLHRKVAPERTRSYTVWPNYL
jgi:hypothetical protein